MVFCQTTIYNVIIKNSQNQPKGIIWKKRDNMRDELLTGTKELTSDNGEIFEVAYYRLSAENDGKRVYGVCLKKEVKNTVTDTAEVYLSESQDHVNFVIDYLKKHTVTPVSLVEVIDCIYDMYSDLTCK
jgi:hypothetical protein